MKNVPAIIERLRTNLRQEDYAGHDVFDGLNSRFLRATGWDRYPLVRLAWIQLFKRSPVNFRWIAGVPKKRNPKGIALVVLGMMEEFERTGEGALLEEAADLARWLLQNRCMPDKWKNHCWGYHFPWEARAFYVPVGTPNIITTCYAVRALLALHLHGGQGELLEAACDAGRFIVDRLYTEYGGRRFFAYIPGERAFIHNASLWGAAVVAEIGRRVGDAEMKDLAYKVCMQSIREQSAEGGWVYGGRSHHGFIDSFHTGYNLEALHMARRSLGTSDFDAALEKGLAYYRRNFFLEDGTPKYYNDSIYPLDMHVASQAVLTCLGVGRTEEDSILAENVVGWSVANMYIERSGTFRYQITRWYKNNIRYMRWTQAWAYYALAYYLNSKAGGEHGKDRNAWHRDAFRDDGRDGCLA